MLETPAPLQPFNVTAECGVACFFGIKAVLVPKVTKKCVFFSEECHNEHENPGFPPTARAEKQC